MPIRKLFPLAAALALALPAAAAAEDFDPLQIGPEAACPNSVGLSTPGQVLGCWCGAGTTGGSVWGTGTYTADSALCAAAAHAGAVDAEGGAVMVQVRPGESSYEGSTAGGVTTSSYGSYGTSIVFLALPWGASAGGSADACPANAQNVTGSLTCSCDAAQIKGTVWGDGVYTDDSSVCAAARHAGVIGEGGGTVTLTMGAGQDSYQGSSANGITSQSYGAWGTSFSFGN